MLDKILLPVPNGRMRKKRGWNWCHVCLVVVYPSCCHTACCVDWSRNFPIFFLFLRRNFTKVMFWMLLLWWHGWITHSSFFYITRLNISVSSFTWQSCHEWAIFHTMDDMFIFVSIKNLVDLEYFQTVHLFHSFHWIRLVFVTKWLLSFFRLEFWFLVTVGLTDFTLGICVVWKSSFVNILCSR